MQTAAVELVRRGMRGRPLAGVAWGVLIALLGAVAIHVALLADLEDSLGLAWLFGLRGPVAVPSEVLIVALDERSEPDAQRARSWSRRDQATVVRYLASQGARVICFDMTFATPSADPAADADFAQAIASAGNVLLAESVQRLGDGSVIETPPIPLLAEAALGYAPFLLPKDARVDQYWSHFDKPTGGTPTLPVLAHHAYRAGADGAPQRRGLVRDWMRRPVDHATRYLNYYGPPRSIATVSHAVVLARANAGQASPSFRDKAVFVGFGAATQRAQDQLRDSYSTVFSRPDGLDISGVEIAATAFANLIEDRPLRPASPSVALLIVIAWGLVAGAACRWLRPAYAVAAMAGAALAYLALAQTRFTADAAWLPVVIPVGIQAPLALFAGVWSNYRDSARERQVIKRAFGYFLPSTVVDRLARNLGPVTRDNKVVFGACLCTDVANYTALAEQMQPGALADLMNAYYAQLFVPVERSQGVVVDVVGDAMVAVWAQAGSPSELAARACAAALDIAAALDAFNASASGRPMLATRLGLHTGDMLVGSIGASGHYEYRAVGDVINTASRIQGLNKVLGTRLLASQALAAGLPALATRPVGSFLLAGKANAVDVVELLGPQAGMGDAARAQHAAFAAGLDLFRSRQWPAARERFATLAEANPGDGPARFYAEHCAGLLATRPPDDWSATIRIDSK